MSRQHCENYDVKRETVHCYREMLTAVARDRWNLSAFSNFAFVLFCYITNHLMTGPLGNSEFCFPRTSMFPTTLSRETLRFSGNKIPLGTSHQVLIVLLFLHLHLFVLIFDKLKSRLRSMLISGEAFLNGHFY